MALVKIQRTGKDTVTISDQACTIVQELSVTDDILKYLSWYRKVYVLADIKYKRKNGKTTKRWSIYKKSVKQDYTW